VRGTGAIRTGSLVAVAAGAAFAWLAVEAAGRHHFGWEETLLARLSGIERDGFEAAMVGFAFLGAGVGLLLLLAAVLVPLVQRRRWLDVAFVTTALLVAQVVNRLVKNTIDKRRPPVPDHELLAELADTRRIVLAAVAVVLVVALATRRRRAAVLFGAALAASYVLYELAAPTAVGTDSFSFPSGHATSSMAFAAAVAVLAWPTRLRVPALVAGTVFVAGVGASRVAFAVHYPTDVLGGWLLALAVVAAAAAALTAAAAWPERRGRRPGDARSGGDEPPSDVGLANLEPVVEHGDVGRAAGREQAEPRARQ
jgi:membrane-associated phospholipid phosphatase